MSTQYAKHPYGSNGYKGGADIELHYYALKKINPIPQCEGALDNDFHTEGHYLDMEYWKSQDLYNEFFTNTATTTIADWERVLGLTASGSLTNRQNNCTTVMRAVASKATLTKAFFIAEATTLGGSSVTIVEGFADMFIVASTSPPATQVTAPLYEISHIWIWHLYSSIPTASYATYQRNLQAFVDRMKPAWTQAVLHTTVV